MGRFSGYFCDLAEERELDRERDAWRGADRSPIEPDRRDRIDINSSAFRRWFGESVMVDAHGRPRLFYHGTSADFERFDKQIARDIRPNGGNALYFSSDRGRAIEYGRNLMVVCLRICRPTYTRGTRYVRPDRGNDGLVIQHEDSTLDEYLVWDASQIMLIRRERAERWE